MAKQHGIIHFTGRLGDVVGFKSKSGDYFLRRHHQVSKEEWENDPRRAPNRKAAANFGSDSRFVTYIRHSLDPFLSLMADGRLHNRLQAQVAQARARCMRDNPQASLDLRKIAPAFSRFSLRKDMVLNDIALMQPEWRSLEDGTRILHIPKFKPSKNKWSRVHVEILRWHIALIPFHESEADAEVLAPQYLQSRWMPPSAISDVEFQIEIPKNAPPILVALGLEPAQGTPENHYPLRTLAVMEILEIIHP